MILLYHNGTVTIHGSDVNLPRVVPKTRFERVRYVINDTVLDKTHKRSI